MVCERQPATIGNITGARGVADNTAMNKRSKQVEALLFYLNEEVGKKRLAELVGCTLAELEEALADIRDERRDSGIVLVETSTTVSLGTAAEAASLIEAIIEAEQVSPLSKAALETLSVVLYQAPVSRAEIDVVRGVNSLYSIRNLLVRGLISRRSIEGKVVYEPTVETLKLLGIANQSELPDYSEVLQKIDQIVKGQSEDDTQKQDKTSTEE